ncbi:MAG TPA: SHOCT domain-containing protein [Desulfobaccales bacterium]
MPHDYFWYWPMWVFPMFMPIFWIAVIIIALFFIFGRGRTSRIICGPGPGPAEETALDILKKRYAKGEITKDEFERMKRDILA